MTDTRRDVAERWLEHISRRVQRLAKDTAGADEVMEEVKGLVRLLRSEGREPDAVRHVERDSDVSQRVYLRGTAPWHQYVHGGNRTDWLPVYFGTPSDSPAEPEDDWSGIADVGAVASRASDSPERKE